MQQLFLGAFQYHVNPMILHAQNHYNPLVHLFVGCDYHIIKNHKLKSIIIDFLL